ncbi:MAG: CHASE2 domain-containing protein [Candidatus Pacebacteria bacterium]|nr:CHASE2 domain-containing protein [Candidatus Paceibacterota bacterium]
MTLFNKIKVRFVAWLSLGLIITLVIYFQLFFGVAQLISDSFFINRPGETEVVLVTIDGASLNSLGRWPWSREKQTKLIKTIAAQEPKAIGYDVVMTELSLEDQTAFASLKEIENLVFPSDSRVRVGQKGHVNVQVASDGKVREIEMYEQSYSAFALVLARLVGVEFNEDILKINYRFARDSFPQVSAQDVLALRKLSELKNKVVLVGVTVPELHDFQQTPLGLMTGVEVQANAVDTLLANRVIKTLNPVQQLVGALIIALAVLLTLEFFGLRKGSLIVGLSAAVLIISCFLSFNFWQWQLPLFYWLVSLLAALATGVTIKFSLRDRERRFVRQALQRYVSAEVLEELIKHPQKLSLTGQTKKITILFLDIRGFTNFAENKNPKEVVRRLNYLLELVTKVIIEHGGTVDKYIGDSVMAFWGAPLKDNLQATHACQAALAIQQKVAEESSFKVGIGVHTGEAVVGNIGSDQRFDYTAIGDTVNTAARLESATKKAKKSILISQAVVDRLSQEKQEFQFSRGQKVKLKGKRQGVKVFGLQASKTS